MFAHRSRWKVLLSLAALSALVFAVAACSADDDDDSSPSETAAPGGGSVTIRGAQFETWDPHVSNFAQDVAHFMMVWRGLYHLDLEDVPQPAMAASAPEVSDDGLTYTVKLKPGLQWSDGDPLLAEDFVLGVQRTCNPDNAGRYQGVLSAIVGCDDYFAATDATDAEKDALLKAVGVRAVDDTTVEFKLTGPQPTFATVLALWPTFPVPVHIVDSAAAPWPGPLQNVYNGPFMPASYTEATGIDLVRNPHWAGGPAAQLDKITIRYIDDDAVATNAFRSGEVMATIASKPELDALKTEFGVDDQLFLYPGTMTIALQFQLHDEALSNPDVRLALSQATDREALVRTVYQNANIASTHWVPPVRNGLAFGSYDEILGFDPEKAKASLARAGYPEGDGLPQISILLRDDAGFRLLGEFLQGQWKQNLGIDVKLDFVDAATRAERYNNKDYQIFIGGWKEDYPDPENWFLGQLTTDAPGNKTNLSIPELDTLVKTAQFNTNDSERRDAYRQAERLLLEGASIAPLFHQLVAVLVDDSISGMVENRRPSDTFVAGDWYPELWSVTAPS